MVHELHHLIESIAKNKRIGPHGATFEDGYRTAEVCDAILRSAKSGRREGVQSRADKPKRARRRVTAGSRSAP
jgi:predicted dehydrogenase